MDKNRKEQIFSYLKSRRYVFLRIAIFLLLAGVAKYIGILYRATFFYTTRFFYPVFLILAILQVWFLLPKWRFLSPRLRKLLAKIAKPFQKLWTIGKEGFRRVRERFSFGRNGRESGRDQKRKGKAYRDESFYAEGSGLFAKRRKHLKWRDMKSNNEKIRYLYMKYVLRGVKEGRPFKYSLTPKELQLLWKAEEKEIVSAYIQARYGNEELPEEQVEVLKKSLQ